MAINIKILGGTPNFKVRLCDTCSYSTVIRGDSESSEKIYCSIISEYINEKIIKCSGYYEKNKPGLKALEDIAWVLTTKKAGREIGFVKGFKLKEENYGELPPTAPFNGLNSDEEKEEK